MKYGEINPASSTHYCWGRFNRRTLCCKLVPRAPDFRDAVVRGFAVESDDLKRVATPELLDSIAGNVLALRLGDRAFADEAYADIRDQAIRAPERWHDLDVQIRLSSIDERSTFGAPRFIVTVKWEYTVVPSHDSQRFACVSDKEEFLDLVSDIPATSAWFMTPASGFDASDRESSGLWSVTPGAVNKSLDFQAFLVAGIATDRVVLREN